MAIGSNPPSGVTLPIRRAWADVYGRWGGRVSNAGTVVCKRIFGRPAPAPWSEHAFGNAWDITGPTAVLNRVAEYLARQPYAAQVLWQGRNLIGGGAVEDHYGHVHLSGKPLLAASGATPPCAGGTVGPEQYQTPAAAPEPLPPAGSTSVGESWEPAAKLGARELTQIGARIARAGTALRSIMTGR